MMVTPDTDGSTEVNTSDLEGQFFMVQDNKIVITHAEVLENG